MKKTIRFDRLGNDYYSYRPMVINLYEGNMWALWEAHILYGQSPLIKIKLCGDHVARYFDINKADTIWVTLSDKPLKSSYLCKLTKALLPKLRIEDSWTVSLYGSARQHVYANFKHSPFYVAIEVME